VCIAAVVAPGTQVIHKYNVVVTNNAGNAVCYTFYKTDPCKHLVITEKQ